MTTSGTPDPTPRSASLLESVDHTRSSLLDAVRTGVKAYAAVWVVTFLVVGATLLAGVLEDDSDLEWSWALTAPGQAIAMSSHGTFVDTVTEDMDEEFGEFDEGEFDEELNEDFFDEDAGEEMCCDEDGEITDEEFTDEEFSDEEFMDEEFGDEELMEEGFGEFSTTVRFSAISLSVLGIMIAVLWSASRRAERRRPTPSRNAVLASAAVTGVTFAGLTWGVAFAARLHIEGTFGHAGSLDILFYGSVLGTVVGLLARRPVARRRFASRLPSALRESARGVAVYLATFVALLVPVAAIYAIVQGESQAILLFPLAILNAAVYGIALGQLGGVEVQGLPFVGEADLTFWLFDNDADGILYVLIPLAIAALLLTIAVLARRSAGRARTSVDAFWLIVTFAGAGVILTAISAATTSTSSFGSVFGGGGGLFSVSFAPAPWLFLVMAGWGVVAEVAIRIVGRPLASVVPDKILNRLAGS